MKKLVPLIVVLAAFTASTVMAQTATGSPSPAASASPAKHKAKAAPTVAPGGGPGLVWVNTQSHVYHKEGTKWYGKTKQGKYMSEQDAMKEGDHAAKGE